MPLFLKFKELEKNIEKLKNLIQCNRCLLHYKKSEDSCSHCKNLTDIEVKNILEEKHALPITYGKYMLFLVIFFLVLLIAINL